MSNHKIVSFVKSGIRIVGYDLGMIAFKHWDLLVFHAFALLLLAEIVGIVEEEFES